MWRNLPEPFKLSLYKIQIVCNSGQGCGNLTEVGSLHPYFLSSHTDLHLNICISCSLEPKYLHKVFHTVLCLYAVSLGRLFFLNVLMGIVSIPPKFHGVSSILLILTKQWHFLLHTLGERFSDSPSELGSWCSRGLKSIAFLLFLPFKCHLNSDNVTLKS